MKRHKIEKAVNKNLPPKAVSFLFQVNSAAFFNYVHSDKEEYSADYIKVNERQPGVFEGNHILHQKFFASKNNPRNSHFLMKLF